MTGPAKSPLLSAGCGMREALAAEVTAGHRERKSAPEIEREYSSEAVAARLDDFYERLITTPPGRFETSHRAGHAVRIVADAPEPVAGAVGRQ